MTALHPVSSVDDFHQVLALNNACTPAVNRLDMQELRDFVRDAAYSVMVKATEHVVGIILALDEHNSYASENYRWFCRSMSNFLYVDRVAISARHQGQGLGRSLYAGLIDFARQRGYSSITAEVNLRPRNEGSLRFHHRLGFQQVAEFDNPSSGKLVSMLRLGLQ